MKYKAAQKLQELKSTAINLAQSEALMAERLKIYCAEACGYKLLYGTERVTTEVMSALNDLAIESQAIDKMTKLQDGEVMNYTENFPCEHRSVLHTATRDFFDAPRSTPAAKSAAYLAYQEVEKLKRFIVTMDANDNFNTVLMIGIGGSDLGPRAHYYALEHLLQKKRHVHFIANVDPDESAAVLKNIDPQRTLVVVSSKSGTTLETKTNEAIVRAHFEAMGVNPQTHFIAITVSGSLLDNRERYLEIFHLWEYIGGRFSTTSMSGGVLLSFAFGSETYWEFLRGAHDMDKVALERDINRNLPLLMALLGIWNRNFLSYPTVAIVPYSRALHRYTAHLQQVDMESNGKLINQHGRFIDFDTGPVIWGEPGTNSQHSFFQLLHQGSSVIPLVLIGFKKSQYKEDILIEGTTSQEKLLANLFAQSLALAVGSHSENLNQFFPGNRPSEILLGEQLTPYALGALLALYEHKVAFQGFIWGINSFDQEGVQLGKVLANNILNYFADQHVEEARRRDTSPLIKAYLQHLRDCEKIT